MKDITTNEFSFKDNWEDKSNLVNIIYGENTMSFNKNGDIKLNDRILENDKEIVDSLRVLLKLK